MENQKASVSTKSLFTISDVKSGMDMMSFKPTSTATITIDKEAIQDAKMLLSAEEFITMCGTQFNEKILN